jgi:hypothetical protein
MSEAALETPEVDVTPEVAEDPAVTELKKRNAGLQRKVQELLAAQAASDEGHTEAREETMPEEVTSQVQQTLEAQAELIRDLYAEKWQSKAVKAHPEAAPFADLLVGPDEKSVMELAQDIATRIKGGQPAAEAVEEAVEEAEEAEAVSETPPVTAGAPGVEGLQGVTESEELAQARAIAQRNPADPRAWDQFLNLKFNLANEGNPLGAYTPTEDQGGVGLT